MKYLILLTLVFNLFSLNAQYTFNLEAGYSNFIRFRNVELSHSEETFLNDFLYFNPLFAWRATFDKRITINNLSGIAGITTYNFGAKNAFYDEWKINFIGIHIGVEYKLKKFYFGLHTYPAIQFDSTVKLASISGGLSGRNKKMTYNLDMSPSLTYSLNEKLMIYTSLSFSMNKAIRTQPYGYKIRSHLIGLKYSFIQ